MKLLVPAQTGYQHTQTQLLLWCPTPTSNHAFRVELELYFLLVSVCVAGIWQVRFRFRLKQDEGDINAQNTDVDYSNLWIFTSHDFFIMKFDSNLWYQ